MRATKKKQANKHSWKTVFLSIERNVFFKSATIQCARWSEKNTFFFGNALPKSNARAHLKQRKKHSGLIFTANTKPMSKKCLLNSDHFRLLWTNN